MDQNQTPSFEIPKSVESAPLPSGSIDYDPTLALEGTHEILPAPQSTSSQTPTTNPTNPQSSPQPVAVPQLPQNPPQPVQQDSHLIADDVDVIEKEWVDRAKKIVSLTSNDPYLEARELNKLKNTYMKKRFNKHLPDMSEGQ